MFNKFYRTSMLAKGLITAVVISGSVAQNVSAAADDEAAERFLHLLLFTLHRNPDAGKPGLQV